MRCLMVLFALATLSALMPGCQPDMPSNEEASRSGPDIEAVEMDQYAWKNRPVVIFADGEADEKLQRQRQIIAANQAGLADRDIVVIEVIGQDQVLINGEPAAASSANALRKQYDAADKGFTALLIGKDTGVKLRQNQPIETDKLFPLIDAMPMRQREMRE